MWYETKNTRACRAADSCVRVHAAEAVDPGGITGTNEISNALKWERTNAPNERLTSFLMEFYNMGVWMASDSVLFEYTGSHGHNQFDFIGFQNWYLEPDYSAMNWYNYSGTDWENVQQSFQTFDELDYRTSMQMNYWLSGSWEPSYRYLYSMMQQAE